MNLKFLILLFICSLVSADPNLNECDLIDLVPGLVKAAKAVDITSLDLFPMDERVKSMNGFGHSIIEFSCEKGRHWNNPYFADSKYLIPDEVESVNLEPAGQLIESVTVHQELESLKNSLDIEGSISLAKEDLGKFALSGGYKNSKEKILSENYTIIDISAVTTSSTIDFRPYVILKAIRGFDEMLAELGSNYEAEPESYNQFLDNYGTHYFSSVKLGGYLIMRTLVSTSSMTDEKSKNIFGGLELNFKNMVNASADGSYQNKTFNMKFDENTRTNFYFYGGRDGFKNGAMTPPEFLKWVESVQKMPWVFAGKLTPISYLIRNGTIRKQVDLAIQAKMSRAALKDMQNTLELINQADPKIVKRIQDCASKTIPNREEVFDIKEEVDKLVQNRLSRGQLGASRQEFLIKEELESRIRGTLNSVLKQQQNLSN